jgi:hypothetical protein
MSRELTIPRKRGETSFARRLTLFALTFTILAIVGIYVRVAPIASTIWLLFIVGLFWIHAKGGLRELLVDWVGAVAGRQFVSCATADTGAQELMFGFQLLGHRFIQLRVLSEQIASVEWSTVHAKGSRRRDLEDWTVWLRFDHGNPVTSPKTSIVPGDERGIWILGATTRSDETEAFGRAFVQFLLDAGAKLVPGARPTAFVRADAVATRNTHE